jgi:hypothetical protein
MNRRYLSRKCCDIVAICMSLVRHLSGVCQLVAVEHQEDSEAGLIDVANKSVVLAGTCMNCSQKCFHGGAHLTSLFTESHCGVFVTMQPEVKCVKDSFNPVWYCEAKSITQCDVEQQ